MCGRAGGGERFMMEEARMYMRASKRIELKKGKDGQVIMRPRNRDFRALKGIVRHNRKSPVSVEEMNEAIARGYSKT